MWHENRLPFAVTIGLIGFICLVTLIRVALVRDRPIDRRINVIAVVTSATVLVREPAIAARLAPATPGGALVLYDVWHFLLLLATALMAALLAEVAGGPDRGRRWRRRLIALAGVYGIAFLLLSWPARGRGMLLQDAHGWQFPTYFGVYTFAILGSCVFYLYVCVPLWRQARTKRDKGLYVVLMFATIVTVVNMVEFYAGVVASASGADSELAHETVYRASGEMMVLNFAVIMLLFVPSCVRAIGETLHLSGTDKDVRGLQPVWDDLTRAAPWVVLPLRAEDATGMKSAEKLHGMRMEIRDAIAAISRRPSAWPKGVLQERIRLLAVDDENLVNATELCVAAERLRATDEAGDDAHDPGRLDLAELAKSWPEARRIRGELLSDAAS